MFKILITGCNSFIGNLLVPFLSDQGHQIYGLSRTFHSNSEMQNKKFFKAVLFGDLSNETFLREISWNPDIIINLAASRGNKAESEKELFSSNVKSVSNLVRFAKRVECNQIIHFSSISIHGAVVDNVVNHETQYYESSIYGKTKLQAEIELIVNASNASIFSLRLPAILGKGANSHWMSRTLHSAIRRENVYIDNPMSRFNNIVYVEDLFKFILHIFRFTNPGFRAFPLGSSTPLTIAEVVSRIISLTNSTSKIIARSTNRPTFTIDDSYARVNFQYSSVSTDTAVTKYVLDELSNQNNF